MFLFSKYNSLLSKYPLVTKSITGGFIFGMADVLAQKIQMHETKKQNKPIQKFNFHRMMISVTMGTVFMTPLFHYWFTHVLPAMVSKVPLSKNSHPFVNVLLSMTIDQTIWATGITCYYFIMINLLEHQSLDKGINTIKQNLWPAMVTNWKVWPAAQILNFWLIPMPYRVLWVNMVGLFWQTYLVGIQHQNQEQK